MSLDDREYARARYRLRQQEKDERLAAMRQRFEEATQERRLPKIRIRMPEMPCPETTAGVMALAILAGCALAVVLISLVQLIN